jgi:hypothetical protein
MNNNFHKFQNNLFCINKGIKYQLLYCIPHFILLKLTERLALWNNTEYAVSRIV